MSGNSIVKVDDLIDDWAGSSEGVYKLIEDANLGVYTLIPTEFRVCVYSVTRVSHNNTITKELGLAALGMASANAVVMSVPELRKLEIPGKNKIEVLAVSNISNDNDVSSISSHDFTIKQAIKAKESSSRISSYEFYIECQESGFKGLPLGGNPTWLSKTSVEKLRFYWLSKYFPEDGDLENQIRLSDGRSNLFIDCLTVAYNHYSSSEVMSEVERDNKLFKPEKVIENAATLWIDSALAGYQSPSKDARNNIHTFLSKHELDNEIKKVLIDSMSVSDALVDEEKPMLLQLIRAIAEKRSIGDKDYGKQASINNRLKGLLPKSTQELRLAIAGAVQYKE